MNAQGQKFATLGDSANERAYHALNEQLFCWRTRAAATMRIRRRGDLQIQKNFGS